VGYIGSNPNKETVMKFVVTCLDDDFQTRVLALKSRVFESLPKAIIYGGTIAENRKASTAPVVDAKGAATAIFSHIVEKIPEFFTGDYEGEILTETTNDEVYAIAFIGDFAAGFLHEDYNIFVHELRRLTKGAE